MIQELINKKEKVDIYLKDGKYILGGRIVQFDEQIKLFKIEWGDTPNILYVPYHAIIRIAIPVEGKQLHL